MPDPVSAGDPVIDFTLRGADGLEYDSKRARDTGLLLFTFWKKTCGTCQFTFPYLQRLHAQYGGPGFQVWGIAQESAADAREFAATYGGEFPQLIDQDLDVTERYDLLSVPAIYLVDSSVRVLRSAPAFVKTELNDIARIAAERTGRPYVPVVHDEDGAPDLKPG